MYQLMQLAMFSAAKGGNPFETVSTPIIQLLDMALTPALGIVGALGAIYCILLGAKLAKAEEPQDREKAKNSLKNALIGFVLIFVLIVALKIGMGAMKSWMDSNIGTSTPQSTTQSTTILDEEAWYC